MQPKPASRLRALLAPEEEEPRPASRLRALLDGGAWEPDPADPRRERRALPAGGFEYRPAQNRPESAPKPPQNRPLSAPSPADPRAALIAAKRAEVERIRAGGDINKAPVEEPSTLDRIKRSAQLVRGGMTEGADFLANLPETVGRAIASPVYQVDELMRQAEQHQAKREGLPSSVVRAPRAMPPPEGLSGYGLPEIVDETLQSARDERERLTEEMVDDLAVNSSPLDAALMATYGPRFTGNLLDPTMLYGPLKARGLAAPEKGASAAISGPIAKSAGEAIPDVAGAGGRLARETAPGILAAETAGRPASRLRALLDEAEPPPARAVPDDFADLYRAAIDTEPPASTAVAPRAQLRIEPGPALDGKPVLLARDADTGDTVGRLVYDRAPGGGFSVHMVETEGRGTGAARQLYKTAAAMEGPYRGSVIRTGEGDALVARLRETDPDIFGPVRPDALPGGGGGAAQAGGLADGVGAGGGPAPGAARPPQVALENSNGPGSMAPEPLVSAPAGAGDALPVRTSRRVSGGASESLPWFPEPMEPPVGPPFRPPVSTKGLETFKDPALREGMEKVGQESFDEIYAARGAPVPVSQWHDAAGLQKKLGLTPDDYLNRPADRGPLSADEGALGKHYLGAMKRDVQALEARIKAGQVEDAAAAQAELATRNRDVVRMMAKLQGQGSSEGGRYLRMLQEALDPQGLAETPKEKLQLALLKHYGAKNADEAAAIEARAVAKLRAQAAREARKAARAATAEELSAEFGDLAAKLGDLVKHPKGMGGGPVPLDPELVAVIGKMAANRIKAGVLAVEELADVVYAAIRQQVGDVVSREQVKASIVEHAMAKPAGKAKLTKPEARLKTAEGAAARRVKLLEEKLAAGPKLPGAKPAPADSARLSALRQRAADLKSQIEKDPKHALVQRYRELLDDDTIDLISKLPDPTEDDGRALVLFLRQMEKPTFRDYRMTYFINSILSGPKTMVRNLAGNVAKLATDTAMRPAAAAVEQGLSRLQGRVPERLVRETLPATMSVFRGIPDGLKRFAFVMKNGYDPARLVSELTGGGAGVKFAEAQRLPLSPFLLSEKKWVRAVGVPVTMPGRILEATDALFKTMASTSEGYAWATRKAIQEGASDVPGRVTQILDDMPEEMVKAQILAAQKATYQDPMSWVGLTASTIRRGPPGAAQLAANLRAKGGLGNKALAGLVQAPETIGQHLVPFIHVSDRVAAAITDFIPGSKPFKLARLVSEQSPEASDLIARQAVGGALGLLGIAWANQGKLVGATPKDEKLRNDFYAEGKQPYSILLGGRWVPVRDALGPLAGPVVAASAYHDHMLVGEDPSAAVAGMTISSARYMLDASYLQSLQDVIQSVDEEGPGAGRKLEQAAARTAAGYVPFSGAVRSVAVARDPRVVDKDGFLDELKVGIPGLREELPSRLGTLNEPLKLSTGAAGGFSPVVPTESKIADPDLEENVGRLRYTVERRRTEINRALADIKDARKLKDKAREAELLALIPRSPSDRLQGDAALDRVRGLEQQIRKLRANDKIPEDRRKAAEIRLQKQMMDILSRALKRLGER